MKIFEAIKNFFRKILKKDNYKPLLLEEKNPNTIDNRREEFIDSLDVKEQEKIKYLKQKLENDEISIDNLTIFEVMDLIDFYKKQLYMK